MKVLNEITLKSLKLNKKRTIVTIIGIILSQIYKKTRGNL